jgi:hypothetical protein
LGRFALFKGNLFRFDPADHGPRDGSALRPWVEALLGARGIDLDGGRIRLLCFPRVLGYGFHEDALRAAVETAGRLGAETGWLTGRDEDVASLPVSEGLPALEPAT